MKKLICFVILIITCSMLETSLSALPVNQEKKSKFRDIFEEKQGFESESKSKNNPQSSDLRNDDFGIGDAGYDPSPIGDSIWFISGLGIAYGMYISAKKRAKNNSFTRRRKVLIKAS